MKNVMNTQAQKLQKVVKAERVQLESKLLRFYNDNVNVKLSAVLT